VGFNYVEPLNIQVLEGESARPFAFASELFSYDGVERPTAAQAALGFSGVRLHAPLNGGDYRDEVIVFQGASYFRSLGRGQVYGLSARALAIDTGEPQAEEFPRFTELFLVRPGADDDSVWVLAQLESKRATGAYAFRITPGESTRIDVTAQVFLRAPVSVLGIAPLTSMYLFGEEEPGRFGDPRPEVHDSDGLAAWSAQGEWIFRPLRNPPLTHVSTFRLDSPRGFGLLQRDRDFASYQDLSLSYQKRPSAWVEPLGDWGRGALRLLEIATERETDDNIAMVWVPDTVPAAGLRLRYRIHMGESIPVAGPAAQVVSTRLAKAGEERMRFVVDFAGPALKGLRSEQPVDVNVSVRGGQVVEQHTEENLRDGRCRAAFEVVREAQADVDLRAFLHVGADVLTETWSYLWQQNP
jgi:glucans biosynthesis protein